MLTKSNRRCAITLMILVAAASLMLLTADACALQGKDSDLKIFDLQGDLILRIDPTGAVFDGLERKIAVIDDREGSLTFMKTHQKIVFKSDPAIQRENDRYTVKIGDGNTLEVKPDGSILLNGTLWRRVVGYTQDDAQKNRFMAAVVIMPLLNLNWYAPDDIKLILPSGLKNAERDSAILKRSIIWIPATTKFMLEASESRKRVLHPPSAIRSMNCSSDRQRQTELFTSWPRLTLIMELL